MTRLADLVTLGRADLARLWSDLIGGDVPASMSQPMQRPFLAFELQARTSGALPPAFLARLDRIAASKDRKSSPRMKPGARLLRAWNGTTHVVDVLPDGFLWNGTRHRSLSAIARAITGARWSGPRFFGIVTAVDEGKAPKRDRRGGLDRAA